MSYAFGHCIPSILLIVSFLDFCYTSILTPNVIDFNFDFLVVSFIFKFLVVSSSIFFLVISALRKSTFDFADWMVTLLLFSMCLNKENAWLYEHITWFSKVYVKRGLFSSCIKSQGRAMAQLLSFITDSLLLIWHPYKGYGHACFLTATKWLLLQMASTTNTAKQEGKKTSLSCIEVFSFHHWTPFIPPHCFSLALLVRTATKTNTQGQNQLIDAMIDEGNSRAGSRSACAVSSLVGCPPGHSGLLPAVVNPSLWPV